jgi:hypothetical protein
MHKTITVLKIEMEQTAWGPIIAMGIVCVVFSILYGLAFYQMSSMIGSKDDYADVKKQLGLIMGLIIAGTVFLGIGAVLVCMQFVDTVRVAYASIFISVFAACMSFGALAAAAITR